MAQQVPLPDEASALDPELDAARDDHTHEVAPDVATAEAVAEQADAVGAVDATPATPTPEPAAAAPEEAPATDAVAEQADAAGAVDLTPPVAADPPAAPAPEAGDHEGPTTS